MSHTITISESTRDGTGNPGEHVGRRKKKKKKKKTKEKMKKKQRADQVKLKDCHQPNDYRM